MNVMVKCCAGLDVHKDTVAVCVRIVTQIACAASRMKNTYFSAQFKRIAKRRGKNRAIIAVAHSILIALYHRLKYDRHYTELGADFFDLLDPERTTRYHVGRLEDLGYEVALTKAPAAALHKVLSLNGYLELEASI